MYPLPAGSRTRTSPSSAVKLKGRPAAATPSTQTGVLAPPRGARQRELEEGRVHRRVRREGAEAGAEGHDQVPEHEVGLGAGQGLGRVELLHVLHVEPERAVTAGVRHAPGEGVGAVGVEAAAPAVLEARRRLPVRGGGARHVVPVVAVHRPARGRRRDHGVPRGEQRERAGPLVPAVPVLLAPPLEAVLDLGAEPFDERHPAAPAVDLRRREGQREAARGRRGLRRGGRLQPRVQPHGLRVVAPEAAPQPGKPDRDARGVVLGQARVVRGQGPEEDERLPEVLQDVHNLQDAPPDRPRAAEVRRVELHDPQPLPQALHARRGEGVGGAAQDVGHGRGVPQQVDAVGVAVVHLVVVGRPVRLEGVRAEAVLGQGHLGPPQEDLARGRRGCWRDGGCRGRGKGQGINDRYRSADPRHQHFQSLVQRFLHNGMGPLLGWGAPRSYVRTKVVGFGRCFRWVLLHCAHNLLSILLSMEPRKINTEGLTVLPLESGLINMNTVRHVSL